MTTKTPFIFRLLYSFSILWLIGTSFALLWNVVFLFRSDHIYFGKGSFSPNPFKNGYSIPVKMNIQLPSDTLVKWESKFDKSSGSFGLNSNVDFRYELADSILNDTVKYSKDIFYINGV